MTMPHEQIGNGPALDSAILFRTKKFAIASATWIKRNYGG